jgi:hypothetical protein
MDLDVEALEELMQKEQDKESIQNEQKANPESESP